MRPGRARPGVRPREHVGKAASKEKAAAKVKGGQLARLRAGLAGGCARGPGRLDRAPMQPRHAVVKNGRLTLDEPTDLPEGRVVLLIPLEELLAEAGIDGGEDDGESGEAEPREVAFRFIATPPQWREPKKIGAQALLDELRSLE